MKVNIAKACLESGIAVMHKGRKYYRINAIAARKYIAGEAANNKPPRILAELYDGVANSVVWVPVDELTLVPEGGV